MTEAEETSGWAKCRRKIREQDVFGIPVQLNLNKQATHNTFLGGCCSIFATIFMVFFIFGQLYQLFFQDQFKTNLEIGNIPRGVENAQTYQLSPQ